MEHVATTAENLKIRHEMLDALIREEECHVWKNLIRIEQIKKEKRRQKEEILRKIVQNPN